MLFLCFIALRDWHARQFLISPIDIKAQTKNPRKRNSPLNPCVGGIRLEGCVLYLTCIFDLIHATCYLLHSTCIMHTCIAYSSCIILTPYFVAIIYSSGSSYVWGWKGGRLVRTDSMLHPINPLCLEATPAEQTEEIEQQQQEGN